MTRTGKRDERTATRRRPRRRDVAFEFPPSFFSPPPSPLFHTLSLGGGFRGLRPFALSAGGRPPLEKKKSAGESPPFRLFSALCDRPCVRGETPRRCCCTRRHAEGTGRKNGEPAGRGRPAFGPTTHIGAECPLSPGILVFWSRGPKLRAILFCIAAATTTIATKNTVSRFWGWASGRGSQRCDAAPPQYPPVAAAESSMRVQRAQTRWRDRTPRQCSDRPRQQTVRPKWKKKGETPQKWNATAGAECNPTKLIENQNGIPVALRQTTKQSDGGAITRTPKKAPHSSGSRTPKLSRGGGLRSAAATTNWKYFKNDRTRERRVEAARRPRAKFKVDAAL